MLLEAKGLYKAFGKTEVLRGIDFSVEAGEVVSMVGKSGAGKTTVLRCITGLEVCSGGSIQIDGSYLCRTKGNTVQFASKAELYEIRKSLGMVFQSYHLFPHKTVLENVTLALTEVYHWKKEAAEEAAIRLLKRLDMGDKLSFKPHALSGGQKQRVAIARSCVTNPQLLCFDEPTAALDSALVLDIIKIIRSLAADGMGILIISHDEKFVRDVSDRVLGMEAGQIVWEKNTSEYEKSMRA